MSKKMIIYAMGQVFYQFQNVIDWDNVVAVADEKEVSIKEQNGVPVIHPGELKNFDYDYISIFSNKYFESIKRELIGTYFIPAKKLVSWKEAICQGAKPEYDVAVLIKNYLNEWNYKKVLDVGMNIIPHSVLSITELLSNSNATIDGLKGKNAVENNCLYRMVYSSLKKTCRHYDVIILSDRQVVGELEVLKEKTDVFLSHFPTLEEGDRYFVVNFDKNVWSLQQMPTVEGVLWIAKKGQVVSEKDVAIYVVTHKDYGVKTDELYRPICVGRYTHEGYVSECEGENISYLNAKINECTALYWIWKNTTHKYVGLNHYRRYFYNSSMKNTGNYLDKETIHKLLEEYDILLPETHPMPVSMREIDRLRTTMDEKAFEQGYRLIRNAIAKNQPAYINAFDDVMNGHNIFVCNMFVTKKEVLDAYCEWLFSFLIEAAEAAEVDAYDNYSKRVIGFFAERMWTVWLRKQTIKIKEMPYDEI